MVIKVLYFQGGHANRVNGYTYTATVEWLCLKRLHNCVYIKEKGVVVIIRNQVINGHPTARAGYNVGAGCRGGYGSTQRCRGRSEHWG